MAPAPASRLALAAPRAVLSGVPPPLGDRTVYCSSSKHFLLLASPCLNKKKTCILKESCRAGSWGSGKESPASLFLRNLSIEPPP